MNIEALPDEIFLCHILPLFSWKELYHTFLNINQRFNNLIQSVRHLSFVVNAGNEHHPALDIFTRSIVKLEVYLGHFDLRSFSYLRSLHLHYPTARQRNVIRPENFPLLKHLKLAYPLEDSILLNLIFSNGFQYLKSCCFDRTSSDHSWSGSPQLRSVSIIVFNAHGAVCILRACPNIVRLNIIVNNEPFMTRSLPRQSIYCMNLLLKQLVIRSDFSILIRLLTCLPNLQRLSVEDIYIYLGYYSAEFDLKLLADALRKLDRLIEFQLMIHHSAWNEHVPWRVFHPLFQSVIHQRNRTVLSGSI